MTRRIVIKIGTSVLTGGTPRPDQARMVDLARQCAALQGAGHEVIVCTSGAIAVGRERLGFPDLPPTLANKQMLAAVGQTRLMQMWERFFAIYGLFVGQLLLTRADVENRRRFLNARDALHTLLAHRVVPIINENDAVATEEIRLGDNDTLSALIAILAEADLLLLLTDQPGLFTADPQTDPAATLIPEVRHIDAALRSVAGDSASGLGVGGMSTKLRAADVARRAGTEVVIAAGRAAGGHRPRRRRRGGGHALPGARAAGGEPQARDIGRAAAGRGAAGRWRRGRGAGPRRQVAAAGRAARRGGDVRPRRHRPHPRPGAPGVGPRHQPL